MMSTSQNFPKRAFYGLRKRFDRNLSRVSLARLSEGEEPQSSKLPRVFSLLQEKKDDIFCPEEGPEVEKAE